MGRQVPALPLVLRFASRAEATRLIQEGRVKVDGHIVRDALAPVVPERIRVTLDDQPARRASWRTILLHKPRGVVTTTNDPEGRPTVFDLVAALDTRFVSVGRLDLATSGLLLLTTDTRLAAWLTDPANGVKRVYLVSVRGEVDDKTCEALTRGIEDEGERLAADSAVVRKRSTRETHLVVDLSEGRNREVRRLFEAVGHEVTRLKRVAFGGLELGALPVGKWREVSREEVHAAFPGLSRLRP
jgi:23S rRNA pseudouridine2605 synthase